MLAAPIHFVIPDELGGVLYWLAGVLRSLPDRKHHLAPGVMLILERPTEEAVDAPDPGALTRRIVIAARRISRLSVPSRWAPEILVDEGEPRQELLGPVIEFRFAGLRGETHVRASCAEHLPPVQELFDRLLQEIEARYPAAGPILARYAADQAARLRQAMMQEPGDAATSPPRSPSPDAGRGGGEVPPPASSSPLPVGEGLGVRSRGRKQPDPKEMNQICAAWLKAQHRMNQTNFCNRQGISPTTLRRWLKGYPHPEQ